MKITAKEAVSAAGLDVAKIGEVSVTIGGLSVNKPEHIIDCQDAVSLVVSVGSDEATVELNKDAGDVTPGAREVMDEQGEIESAKAAEIAEAKAKAKEVAA